MRRKVDGAIAKCADHSAYIRHCEWYLKHGDWIDNFYGEYEEKKVQWVTINQVEQCNRWPLAIE